VLHLTCQHSYHFVVELAVDLLPVFELGTASVLAFEEVIRAIFCQMLLQISSQPRVLPALWTLNSSVLASFKEVLNKVLSDDSSLAIFWILGTSHQSVSTLLAMRLQIESPYRALLTSDFAAFALCFLVMFNFWSCPFKFYVAF